MDAELKQSAPDSVMIIGVGDGSYPIAIAEKFKQTTWIILVETSEENIKMAKSGSGDFSYLLKRER